MRPVGNAMLRNVWLAVALAGAIAGCSSSPLQLEAEPETLAAAAEVKAATGTTFRLAPGQTASVGGQLLVSFRGVKSDSRCPKGAACVWAGDAEAVIGMAVERGSWSWISLHTGLEPRSVRAQGYVIRLVDVEPGAVMNTTIAAERYVAVLEVTGQ